MNKSRDRLVALLKDQGFGSRKDCLRLIHAGGVEIGTETGGHIQWRLAEDPEEALSPAGLHFRAAGHALPYLPQLYLALHKPAETECSHAPTHYPSVFGFFPEPFLRRGLQAAGRLDADTTGLLLLSDSGPFIHFLTSPRRHVSKAYRVETRHAITPEQLQKLEAGVELRGEDGKTQPVKATLLGERQAELVLEEGKYHQVKRMFAAAGNRVEKIHRFAVGGLRLDEALAPGRWRYLTGPELARLGYPAQGAGDPAPDRESPAR